MIHEAETNIEMGHDFQLQAKELGVFRHWFVLSPNQWAGYSPLAELSWTKVVFNEGHAEEVPDDAMGVYTFVLQPGIAAHDECSYLTYVGSTVRQNLRARYKQYLGEQRTSKPKRPHVTDMLTKWDGYLFFCYAPITDAGVAIATENRLQTAFVPPFCRKYPTTIRTAMKVLR